MIRATVRFRWCSAKSSCTSARIGASFGSGTICLSFHWYPYGAPPPIGFPIFARIGTDARTRSAISSRSHCAMAAIIVKKSRPAGELVSIASWSEIRSAPPARNSSANSRSSRVLRARRANFENTRPVIVPALMSWSMRCASGCALTALPLTASRRYTFTTSQPRASAYARARFSWCSGLSPRTWSSVETRIQIPTDFASTSVSRMAHTSVT